MTDLVKCSDCRSWKMIELFAIKTTTGVRFKTCTPCRERVHMCPHCNSEYRNLPMHIKSVHHKIRDQKCPHCDFRASDAYRVTAHVKAVHDQIRDYNCPHCDYVSSCNGNVNRHIESVHDRSKNECPKCCAQLSIASDLRAHMRVCTGSMSMSSGEYAVKGILDDMGIQYEREMRFVDCKDIRPLPFDFYLPQHIAAIEYDGEQHFKAVSTWGGQEALEKQQLHDGIKTAYCANNNIRLLRIKYTDFERAKELITAFLSVPLMFI